MAKINNLEGYIGSSYSMMPHNISYPQTLSDQSFFFPVDSKGCTDMILKIEEGEEDLCKGLSLDSAPLNFDVVDDIMGCSAQEHIESDSTVPNCLLIYKNNISVTASNFTIDHTLEAASPGQQDCISQVMKAVQGITTIVVCLQTTGFIMSDSPWESNLEVGSPQAKNEAKLRFKDKKLKRTFDMHLAKRELTREKELKEDL